MQGAEPIVWTMSVAMFVLGALLAQAPTTVPSVPVVRETVFLTDGRSVTAPVLKSTEEALWIDLGFDVLRVPLAAIVRREVEDVLRTGSVVEDEVFARAELSERSITEGAATVEAGVVKIESPAGQGSGFITSTDGYVVTNFHVVEGETEVTLTLYLKSKNGYDLKVLRGVKVVAIHPEVDLALVKFEPPEGVTLTRVFLGDSDLVRAGDRVYAIGTPIGLERTVSNGIVSVANRTMSGFKHFQIDVAINPGNSGGPLFNLRGEVVGVNCAGYGGLQGLNFAIPTRHVVDFLRDREAWALDPSRPEFGVHYLTAPRKPRAGQPEPSETGR